MDESIQTEPKNFWPSDKKLCAQERIHRLNSPVPPPSDCCSEIGQIFKAKTRELLLPTRFRCLETDCLSHICVSLSRPTVNYSRLPDAPAVPVYRELLGTQPLTLKFPFNVEKEKRRKSTLTYHERVDLDESAKENVLACSGGQ